ncbi:MAG TPA: TIGR03086 family metal-binding protein [Trebonia sp.]|jgi:uncharacterized protein (TIGR03086 family)|nr:TIGR03086 family metal-binding protein [Trebonia sp.]
MRPTAFSGAARGLLRQSVTYALASADLVTPVLLTAPTPCAGWSLGMLLSHVSESLEALADGLTLGTVTLAAAASAGLDELDPEPAGMRARCARLLAAIEDAPADSMIAIAGQVLPDSLLACAGAIEMTVHGWDIAAACGAPRAIPASLASTLLDMTPVLLPDGARDGLFAAPLPVPLLASPGEHLLAFLGRVSTRRGGDESVRR